MDLGAWSKTGMENPQEDPTASVCVLCSGTALLGICRVCYFLSVLSYPTFIVQYWLWFGTSCCFLHAYYAALVVNTSQVIWGRLLVEEIISRKTSPKSTLKCHLCRFSLSFCCVCRQPYILYFIRARHDIACSCWKCRKTPTKTSWTDDNTKVPVWNYTQSKKLTLIGNSVMENRRPFL